MKQWLFLVAAVLVIAFVMLKSRERFQPEFLDRSQVAKTVAVQGSSYDQATNHMDPAPWASGPPEGHETPFQVNQYRAFVV
jgi:hypothetical protein